MARVPHLTLCQTQDMYSISGNYYHPQCTESLEPTVCVHSMTDPSTLSNLILKE